ncbi:coiled-coil domain-containing protein 153-like isoform X2 [Rhinatrema bivittatum]|uniref:coiled-coil domain-containing protein 153-like isoform X2 n=1 Tax=Rhinatrema bivittatum TaxID=194408 RepID=UPI00112C66B6|nr:coiled-coil domain-containing protein 153-like isoform X2 [Rhinatrema bivittatum]
MPPKKKEKARKKGKQKKSGTDHDMEERFRRTVLEVEVLQDHLALRRDVARQAEAKGAELKARLLLLEQELQHERDDKKDIYAGSCQQEMQQLQEENQQILLEKNQAIVELQRTTESIEAEYEKILHATLDNLLSKLTLVKLRWTSQAISIHSDYKQRLQECGLNPLDI